MGPDARVAALARRQHGVVTVAQLRGAGLSHDAIGHRAARGRLVRLHRGVYLASPSPAQFTAEMAAVLACGPHAVLSHHAAAALWEIRPRRAGPIDVTVSAGRARPRPGIAVHRSPHLPTATAHGIPITTPARTLRDLAAVLPRHELERATEEARVRRLVPLGGAAAALTRSEAERRLLDLIRAAELPAPLTNTRVAGFEVDMAWPSRRLIVEIDGFAFHSTRAAFERDRVRDATLQAAGWRVMRVTWRQLVHHPEAVVARLAAALVVVVTA